MIRYDLKCSQGCEFDAWFKNSAAFDASKAAGQLHCALCGSADVSKAPMAPRVSTSKRSTPVVAEPMDPDHAMAGALTTPKDPELTRKLKDLQDYLDKNSDDVGAKFAEEARKIHYGETDSRQIHGVASLEDARELTEEGVSIAPLPLLPRNGN